MSFAAHKRGAATVIEVAGQLIIGNRHELKSLVLDRVQRGERHLVIDFSQTGYIDSSGLGVLVGLSKRIREMRGSLRLAGLSPDLQRLFELTRLDTLFEIRDDLEQALSS